VYGQTDGNGHHKVKSDDEPRHKVSYKLFLE
jgi:hypothetical protein